MTSPERIRRPHLFDVLDLALLRAAKLGRRRFDVPESFYDDFFAEHDSVKYQRDVRNAWRFRRVVSAIEEVGAATVVDVGCGLGVLAHHLPSDTEYVGVDLSPATVAQAKRLSTHPHARFVVSAFPHLALESDSADLAVCQEVLEHLEDDEAAVAELARVVRPGGHLVVSVPQTYYWPAYLAMIGHFRHYTAETLEGLLRRGGFTVVRRYPMLPRLWRLHHYVYVLLRAWESVRRSLWRDARYSLYESRAYRVVGATILDAALRREGRDDPSSTFVLARRVELGR